MEAARAREPVATARFESFAAFSTACPPAFTSLPAPSTVLQADSASTETPINAIRIAFICDLLVVVKKQYENGATAERTAS